MNEKINNCEPEKLIELGRAVIKTETNAVKNLSDRIDQNFVTACLQILKCSGNIEM
jgi:D-arabinose 5-phosphate isomerase GutQ